MFTKSEIEAATLELMLDLLLIYVNRGGRQVVERLGVTKGYLVVEEFKRIVVGGREYFEGSHGVVSLAAMRHRLEVSS